MVVTIERRDKDIEEMRRAYLEYYFDEESHTIDADTMQTLGLNMYSKLVTPKKLLYNAFCRSNYDSEVVMHPQQIECLNYLMRGDNLLISAPTSFGKTFVALEYMSRKGLSNIVFVVPTLALMNELFVKIKNKFGQEYNIIQNGYENVEEKNIYIIVPERADISLLSKIQEIDLLVFDEIYKLQRKKVDDKEDKRIISLNRGYFELVNRSKQVLLLGPFIKDISFERTKLNDNITKYITDYSPVYVKINFRDDKDEFILDEIETDGSKLVYFNSPVSIYKFAVTVLKQLDLEKEDNSLTQWCDKYISNKWLASEMLKRGIGIHHGKLPNFMRRYIENLYNDKELKTIFCTSTLLEGINTPTNELLVYDSNDMTAFKINNLIGRVGRLSSFQKGQVYLFDRDLEKYLLGDEKYEEVSIVAEMNEIVDLEEVIYLNKPTDELSVEQMSLYNKLQEGLKKYGKTVEDLQKTDGFVIVEFLRLIDAMPKVIETVKKLQAADDIDKTKIKGALIEIFMGVIKYTRSYSLVYINNTLPEGKRIKNYICVSKLLNLKPESIYQKIQKEVNAHSADMSEDTLNLFIDYLFDLAFSYIKYELTRIVSYLEFIFEDSLLKTNEEMQEIYNVLEQEILKRLRIFNCNNDLLMKILIDLDFPYLDAKEISKMIVNEIEENKISTSAVLDVIDSRFDDIMKNKKIDDVTKDLLKVLLKK